MAGVAAAAGAANRDNPLELEEVVEVVFGFLPLGALARCRRVCRLWRAVRWTAVRINDPHLAHRLTDERLALLASTSPQELHINSPGPQLTAAGFAALRGCPRLTRLTLRARSLPAACLASIADLCGPDSPLRELHLPETRLGPSGAALLAKAMCGGSRLRKLHLCGSIYGGSVDGVGTAGVVELASMGDAGDGLPHRRTWQLESLDLSRNGIASAQPLVAALLQGRPALASLRRLSLSDNSCLDADTCHALAQLLASPASPLRSLALSNCFWSPRITSDICGAYCGLLTAVAATPMLALQHLDLSNNTALGASPESTAALAALVARPAPSLAWLNLTSCGLRGEAALAMARALQHTAVAHIILDDNHLALYLDELCLALATNDGLERLELAENQFKTEDIPRLEAAMEASASLRVLALDHDRVCAALY